MAGRKKLNSFETSPANRSNYYCERLLLSSWFSYSSLFRDDVRFRCRYLIHNFYSPDSFSFLWILGFLGDTKLGLLNDFSFFFVIDCVSDTQTVFSYTMAALWLIKISQIEFYGFLIWFISRSVNGALLPSDKKNWFLKNLVHIKAWTLINLFDVYCNYATHIHICPRGGTIN